MNTRLGWAAYIALGVVVDLWRDSKDDDTTLSATTRRTFRVDTPVGRVAFLAAWGFLAAWFAQHITNREAIK